MNKKNLFNRFIGTTSIPLTTFIAVNLICVFQGVKLFETAGNYIVFFRSTASVMLTTIALSINLDSGRFDFSIGSVALLSSVISATIALNANLSVWTMLIISVFVGAILGLISGLTYVVVKLPPIIISLGVALLYEGIAFVITNGFGVSFVTNIELTSFPNVINYLVIISISLLLVTLVFDYTEFGYSYRALQTGQKVAVTTGIREVKNAVVCYVISGSLMGVVGFISATHTGTIQMALNFASIGVMFTAFLPMFIGGYIRRFTNANIGYLMGAVTTAFISLMYARVNVDSSIQQIVTAIILVAFLIYLNNEKAIGRIINLIKKRGNNEI
ncbi:hypothetical protein AOC36_11095 [Erysipelothrix larvae]|uniref:Sugar ABC transporter permease n=1 Tax=Erysipelothrix larvae TaxID=1514105 RepID=A0A0X8H1Q2_9FIRM|nr:hypothetical protein [Erysipelothrix larvae]AMC94497.1 hypothetical protein AOC36_11095 [Erysipelothrix larvae]